MLKNDEKHQNYEKKNHPSLFLCAQQQQIRQTLVQARKKIKVDFGKYFDMEHNDVSC